LAGIEVPLTVRSTYAIAFDGVDFEAAGWGERRAFYTGDLPYLWGRPLAGHGAMFGGGWSELGDVVEGRACLERLEARVRGLHPAFPPARAPHGRGRPTSVTR